MRGISGNAQQFAQGDAELCNYEAEHDDADAGANPGEEGALVGEMAARFAGGYRRPGSRHGKAIACTGPEKQAF